MVKLSIQEFGDTIKQKYPEYQNQDSTVLGQKMLEKYPQYLSKVQTPITRGSQFPTSPMSKNFTPQAPKKSTQLPKSNNMTRNRPVEALWWLWQSVASFLPRTAGAVANFGTKIGEWLGKAQEKIFGLPKQQTPQSLTGLWDRLNEAWDKWQEAVKSFMERTWVRQDTWFSKGGKLVWDIVQSVIWWPKWAALPRASQWVKWLANYVGSRWAIWAAEGVRFNIGTQWKVLPEEWWAANIALWAAWEVIVPAMYQKAARALLSKAPSKVSKQISELKVQDIEDDIIKWNKTEWEAILDLMKESKKYGSVPWVSDDIVREATKDPNLLNEYWTTVMQRNLDTQAPSALEKAASKWDEAYDMLQSMLKDTGSDIGKFKQNVATTKLQNNRVKEIERAFSEVLDNLNLTLNKWKVVRKPWKVGAGTPTSDINTMQTLYGQWLKTFKESPTMENYFDLLTAIRKRADYSTWLKGKSSDQIKKVWRELSARLRKIVRQDLSTQQKKIFDEYADLVEFLSVFDKKAGTDSKMWLLLRRATSAKAFENADMMKTIEKYTGIDLNKHSHLSRIATELLAETEGQRTLLQSTVKNAGIDAAELAMDAANANFGNMFIRIAKRFLPKADPYKTLQKVANKYDPWMSYDEAVEIVKKLKNKWYDGTWPLPNIK